jgi:hypothetical protein
MARTLKHHHELTNHKGKCSVPMFSGGAPAGFCDADAFGEPPTSPRVWHSPKQMYVREDGKYDGYVPGLACPAHGGPKCPGLEIEEGVFSGCNQSAGDCPTCGR